MTIIQALIYGIVQGLGEFLPISSTAHLLILQKIFGQEALFKAQNFANTFDIALHIGTLVAVILFFWKDWIRLIKSGFTDVKSASGRLFWCLAIACIPGGIAGVLFEDKITKYFHAMWTIGLALIIMGFVLYITDKYGRERIKTENAGFFRSIVIGISQALAIIPGVSRSGITIAAGRVMGLTREAAARFTFLLSTPFILGSALYKLKDMKDIAQSQIGPVPFAVAIVTSGIVGALSIKFLLNYLKKRGFGIFVVYRIVIGIVLISTVLF
ncbi:MAG: undecaprenyl-diphosphatase UppP [Bacillota bacterium]|nr:undecaprenyl-diphosphatase UppP [Bacillota bacterium]